MATPRTASCSPRSSSGWPSGWAPRRRWRGASRTTGCSARGSSQRASRWCWSSLAPHLFLAIAAVMLVGGVRGHRVPHRAHDHRHAGRRRDPRPGQRVRPDDRAAHAARLAVGRSADRRAGGHRARSARSRSTAPGSSCSRAVSSRRPSARSPTARWTTGAPPRCCPICSPRCAGASRARARALLVGGRGHRRRGGGRRRPPGWPARLRAAGPHRRRARGRGRRSRALDGRAAGGVAVRVPRAGAGRGGDPGRPGRARGPARARGGRAGRRRPVPGRAARAVRRRRRTALDPGELEDLAVWATGRLRPDVSVLLDRAPIGRSSRPASGLAGEEHVRVRRLLTHMAAAEPHRYVVVDADGPADEVAERDRRRARPAAAARPAPAEAAGRRHAVALVVTLGRRHRPDRRRGTVRPSRCSASDTGRSTGRRRARSPTPIRAPKPLRSRRPADGPVAPAAGPPLADTNPVVTTISEPPPRGRHRLGRRHRPHARSPQPRRLHRRTARGSDRRTAPELRPSCADHDPAVATPQRTQTGAAKRERLGRGRRPARGRRRAAPGGGGARRR